MRRPFILSSLVLAAATAGVVTGASAASAAPLCYSAGSDGAVDTKVGPFCVTQYPYGVTCLTESAGLDPTQSVTVSACSPL